MNNLINAQNDIVMSSLDFWNKVISPARNEAGEASSTYQNFLVKVIDELDLTPQDAKKHIYEKINELGFSRKYETPVIDLNIEQMTLVGMRESKAVRRSVLTTLKSLSQPQPKSQAEIVAAMAMTNLEHERRMNGIEQKVIHVEETVEQIKQGTIPVGWIGYSMAKTKSGMTVDKCKTLAKQYNIRKDQITILTPEGMPRPMAIIHEADFTAAMKHMMNEAEKRGTRWYHSKMGIFQAIGWEDK